MQTPNCERCGEKLPTWSANVMVNSDYSSIHVIQFAKVICKPCTRKMYDTGEAKLYHNLWELSWLKEPKSLYMFAIAGVMDDLVDDQTRIKWTRVAVGQVLTLIAMSINVPIEDPEEHARVWDPE